MGDSGVNALKVVNLLILLNSKTIEVLTQHSLCFSQVFKKHLTETGMREE